MGLLDAIFGMTEQNNPVYDYPVPTRGFPVQGRNRVALPGEEAAKAFPWGAEGIADRLKRIQLGQQLNAALDALAAQQQDENAQYEAQPLPALAQMLTKAYPTIPELSEPAFLKEEPKLKLKLKPKAK